MSRPVLWQLRISHYNEKVRWALDHKRIPHVRRSLLPGPHVLVARRLAGARTTPVLTLGDRSIAGSGRILAALEERWPDPPLYPAAAQERGRALALAAYFDEQLGPAIRRVLYQELLPRPDLLLPAFAHGQPAATRAFARASFPLLRAGMRRALDITPAAAEASRARLLAVLDRLEAELGSSGYLVGDAFTVADLTAAALAYPIAAPPEFPYPQVDSMPPAARELLDELGDRRAGRWVKAIYRDHRY